jgi:hypothetical protein
MTEAERRSLRLRRVVAAEAVVRFGKRLARTEFDSLAGRRNPEFDTAAALEFVDLARFVGEDGEPDVKVIKAAVEKWVPELTKGPPSYDGGARTTAKSPPSMNELLKGLAGYGQ